MDGLEIRRMGPGDAARLEAVPPGLFDGPVIADEARAFLADPAQMLWLGYADGAAGADVLGKPGGPTSARIGDQPGEQPGALAVGLVSGTVLRHPDKRPVIFVNELGVREGWRRRGIARALMRVLFDTGAAMGVRQFWLGTEPENRAARALYRALGGDEVPFTGFGWGGALE